jgi:hypothetical protein
VNCELKAVSNIADNGIIKSGIDANIVNPSPEIINILIIIAMIFVTPKNTRQNKSNVHDDYKYQKEIPHRNRIEKINVVHHLGYDRQYMID